MGNSDPQGTPGNGWRWFWPSPLEGLLTAGGQSVGMCHTSCRALEGPHHRMIQPGVRCTRSRGLTGMPVLLPIKEQPRAL